MIAALRSAVAFGTVIPTGDSGRRPPGPAMLTALPAVGALLGLIAAALLQAGFWAFGPHSLPAGALTVAALALLTRGLHIDGLADTVDGLACYGPPQRSLAVMRDGSTGPLGVAAVVLTVLAQAAAMSSLAPGSCGAAAVLTAVVTGRVAAVLVCRRGVPAAAGSSLGAAVAGSQPAAAVAAWILAVAAFSTVATPRVWQGPLAVLIALAAAAAMAHHCVRRFGGVTGDVLGAVVEMATVLTVLGLAIRS